MSKLGKWRQLSRTEQGQLLRAWCILPWLVVALRLWGYGRCRAWLTARSRNPAASPPAEPLLYAQRLARMIGVAGRFSLLKAVCLPQSLLLWHWLRQRGVDSHLCFGAHKKVDLQAHAWVECEGQPLNQSDNLKDNFQIFRPVPRFLPATKADFGGTPRPASGEHHQNRL